MFNFFTDNTRQYLASLDPERIYVENVRHLLGVNEEKARLLCDEAEDDGVFEKWIGYEHPTLGRFLVEAPADTQPEDRVYHCDVSEGHEEKCDFRLGELKKRVFYRALSNG
jgi:hypothetical protein